MKTLFLTISTCLLVITLYSQQNTQFEKPWFENNEVLKQPSYNTAMDNYDVKFYYINLSAGNLSKNISGSVSMLAQVLPFTFTEIVVELHSSLTVDSLWVDSINTAYTRSGTEIHVNLSTPLIAGEYFFLTVFYHGSSTGSGIKNATSSSWGKKVTYTLAESYHGLDWYPCKQALTDKADSAWIFITVANGLKAGSNGVLTQIVPDGATKSRFEWKTRYPIDYYLLSIAVSDYQEYNIYAHPQGTSDSILIQNYIYPNSGFLPQYQVDIDRTDDFIEFLSEIWGLYPFSEEKYGHCTAPFSGGMEHQTMTSLGFFSFELVIHELAHMWFGDFVTCATWQDIWVNEGFATYSNYLGLAHFNSYSEAQTYMYDMHDDIMSQPDGCLYVPFADVMDEGRIFDYRLTYEKGAAIIHTMRFIVNNDSLFFAAFRDFLQTYSFGTAYADDFRDILESHTGIDFHQYFDEWFYGEGFPTYSLQAQPYNDSLLCTLTQTTSMPSVTPVFTNPLEIKFVHTSGDTTLRVQPAGNSLSFNFYFPYTVTEIIIDPENDIVNESGTIVVNVSDISENNTVVFPNPAKDRLYICDGHLYNNYFISDINGRVVAEGMLSGNYIGLDLFVNGIYQLTLSGKSDVYKTCFVHIDE